VSSNSTAEIVALVQLHHPFDVALDIMSYTLFMGLAALPWLRPPFCLSPLWIPCHGFLKVSEQLALLDLMNAGNL